MSGFSAIVFDMDGVLVDSPSIHREVWRDFVSTAPWQEIRDYQPGSTGRRSKDVLTECIGHLVTAQEIDQVVTSLHQDFLRRCAGRDMVFPSMRRAIEHLVGRVPIGIATSAPRSVARETLGDLFDCFDGAVTGDECAAGKPDPEVYIRARSIIGAADANTLAIEDTTIGVAAAVSAACRTWAVSVDPLNAGAAMHAGAELVASHVDVLADLLIHVASGSTLSPVVTQV